LDGSFVIVGDLHGHFLDLCRIFKTFQYPNTFKYVFLGDVVDRGQFSFETIFLILLLKYFFPTSVYLIRGNHEFRSLCSESGFLAEIEKLYPEENIFDLFIDIFDVLPLAALLQKAFLCLHGGICPELKSLNQLKSIKKPISNYTNSLISGLVWSDPFEEATKFLKNNRGAGYLFGKFPLQSFLQNYSLKMLIRAHECAYNGINYDLDNRVVTVFSASNYCGNSMNKSGVLMIKDNGEVQTQIFQSFQYLMREKVIFHDDVLPNLLMSTIIQSSPLLSSRAIIHSKKLLSDMKRRKQQTPTIPLIHLSFINV
jgi:protein phosphatase